MSRSGSELTRWFAALPEGVDGAPQLPPLRYSKLRLLADR
jgi:hypothetical protein